LQNLLAIIIALAIIALTRTRAFSIQHSQLQFALVGLSNTDCLRVR